MMVIGGGRERTVAEHQALIEAAGFTLTKVVPTQSEVSVIEAILHRGHNRLTLPLQTDRRSAG
jgi:hypothetical protein